MSAAPHLGRGCCNRDKGGSDGASLGIDGDATGGDGNEGGCNIETLRLNVHSHREDGDKHLQGK